jgi:hypothetical protein
MEQKQLRLFTNDLVITKTGIVIGSAYQGPRALTYGELWLKELLLSERVERVESSLSRLRRKILHLFV